MDLENAKKQLVSLLGTERKIEIENLDAITINTFIKEHLDEVYQKMNTETAIITNGEVTDYRNYCSQFELGEIIPLSSKLHELSLIYNSLSKIRL